MGRSSLPFGSELRPFLGIEHVYLTKVLKNYIIIQISKTNKKGGFMELRQLQYYVSIIDNNSFSIAAEENYISQSAISQQLKALEKELGYELITRKNRSFTITSVGEFVYKESKKILSEIDSMQVKAKLLAGNDKYTLRVGYLIGYNGNELLDTISEFKEKYPEVEIELVADNHDEVADQTLADNVDLMFGDQRRAFSKDFNNYNVAKLYKYISVANYNNLSKNDKLTIEDLQNETCIIICSKEQRQVESKYYRDILGFKGKFIYARSLDEAKLLVASNKGFLSQCGKLQERITDGAIAEIPYYDTDGQITVKYYAYWKKSISNPIIEAFARILKNKF